MQILYPTSDQMLRKLIELISLSIGDVNALASPWDQWRIETEPQTTPEWFG
jgi:hypothetical protein